MITEYGLGETIYDELSGIKDRNGELINFTGFSGWFALSRSSKVDWANAAITGTMASGAIESDTPGHLRVIYYTDPAQLDPDRIYTRWLKVQNQTGEQSLYVRGQPVKFTSNPTQSQSA